MSFMTLITLATNADTQALGANINLLRFNKLKDSVQYDVDDI